MTDYNAAEREDVKAASRAARQFEVQRREVITQLMSAPPGRAWMHERLERCHVFATSYTGEALSTAFAEGERNIGLMDLNDIMSACPDQYIQMQREANVRNQSSAATRELGRGSDGDGGDQAESDAVA